MMRHRFVALLKTTGRIIRWVGWIIALTVLALALLTIVDHYGGFSAASPFFGIDSVSPLWIFLLLAASAVIILAAGSQRFWIPVAAGAVYFVLFGDISLTSLPARIPTKAVAVQRTLRVATFNVEYYSEGVNKVMDAIEKLDADVVLLGEHALTSANEEQMRGRLHGRTLVAGHPNSTAILTTYPVVWWKEIELPSHEASLSGGNDPDEVLKNRHRSFVHAVAKIDSRCVHLISIRFIAGRPKDHSLQEQIRWGRFLIAEQYREAQFFTAYIAKLREPVIFGGDLNACASSKNIAMLSDIADDAYLMNNIFGDLTFRTEFPTLRLDYLFSKNGVRSVSAHRPLISGSDHYPVVGTFVLPGRQGSTANDSGFVDDLTAMR